MRGDRRLPNVEDMTEQTRPLPPRSLPWWAIVGLALLAAPRVVLHDLGIIEEGTVVNGLFVFLPPIIWIAVVVGRGVARPLLTLVLVGLCYGAILVIGHQLLWDLNLGSREIRLGGNLAGLEPGAQEIIIRVFAGLSSVVTGLVVGMIAAVVAWLIATVRDRVVGHR